MAKARPFAGNMPIRVQPDEWQEDISWPVGALQAMAPQPLQPQKYLRVNKPLWGVRLRVEAHVRYAVGAAIQVTAPTLHQEFPLGAIDQVGLSGTSKFFGSLKRFRDLNHNTFWNYVNLFAGSVPQICLVSRNGAAYQQVQGPGSAQVTAPANVANTNTDYDIIIHSLIPFVPLLPKIGFEVVTKQQVPYLIREGLGLADSDKIWRNLALLLNMADYTGLFDNVDLTKSTITFGARQGTENAGGTAAAAGSPIVRLSLIPVMFGNSEEEGDANADAMGVGKAVLYQQKQVIQSPVLTGSVPSPTILQRLATQIPHYARLLIKTGTQGVNAPSAGVVSVMDNLSDSIFSHVEIRRLNKAIRFADSISPLQAKEAFRNVYGTPIPTGYLPISFVSGLDLNSAVNVSGLSSDNWTANGSSVGGATNIGEIMEETFEVAA